MKQNSVLHQYYISQLFSIENICLHVSQTKTEQKDPI